MGRSLIAGEIVEVAADAPPSACDALLTRRVADMTFATLRDTGAVGTWASEAEVRAAMRFAFAMGLVVEPGGAVALAAWLAGRVEDAEGATVIVCSGSNVDPVAYAGVLAEA
jgi:threonine dehydratase